MFENDFSLNDVIYYNGDDYFGFATVKGRYRVNGELYYIVTTDKLHARHPAIKKMVFFGEVYPLQDAYMKLV
jgi:hypothetical protein